MDIKFIKREELQEKPDQKKLGFGKYFADYMFTMDFFCIQWLMLQSLTGDNKPSPDLFKYFLLLHPLIPPFLSCPNTRFSAKLRCENFFSF